MNIYDIFFSICLGLFISGILLSIVSLFLAQLESNILGEGELDVDVDLDIDVDACLEANTDLDIDINDDIDAEFAGDITPAPIMLLISTFLLVFGISGMLLYYLLIEWVQFTIFFITPILSSLTTKLINKSWKKIAKSRYYRISSTQNLIGVEGEVILRIDDRGGVIKIISNTPMKYEKIHVKPLNSNSRFEKKERVYICDVRNNFLLVDNDKKSIRKKNQ